ncbi:uncharacterized protein LOC127131768 [Lathyrus oleraceus]|uniref:uncharacterized protein LOC127131768 n=1 Tax=Pisum sativum TaxID=3888 RepID=UPI0021D087E8|nr:uncharacterized protein LOC127131768 [Pisum sativum]
MEYVENFNLISEMVGDALGVNVTYDEPEDFDGEGLPNEKAQRFYQLLNEMHMSLFEGSSDTKLSMCVRLLASKSNWNVPGEDPHKHLKEFQVVCSTPLRPEGITEDHIKLRAFPSSLQGAAKDWLYYLESNSVTTWNDLKRVFLESYFPASRAASIRKDICGIRQGNESLAEYRERFKQLVSSYPQHQITEQLLIQYFYEGLLPMDRNILDVVAGGALVDKTPVAAKALIENMSLNSQQFTTRNNYTVQTKGVNDIQVSSSNKALETRIEELTSLVKQMIVSKPQTTKLCDIYTYTEHPTDVCHILQDDSVTQFPQAYAANFFNQSNNQRGYNIPDLSTNKYHPNWRNHLNLRYGNHQPTQQQLVIPLPQPQTTPQVSTSAPSGPSLEDLVKQMAVNNLQFQQQIDSSIQTLQTQIGQLTTSMNAIQQAQGSNQIPAQTVVNPKGLNANVSAISLRSEKISTFWTCMEKQIQADRLSF